MTTMKNSKHTGHDNGRTTRVVADGDNTLSAELQNLISVTVAGFKTTFRCNPASFRAIYRDGKLCAVEVAGDVDAANCEGVAA
jgi:hypothetical protein